MPEPKVLRASRPPDASRHSTGHHAGLHPEDRPHHTTQTRVPARVPENDPYTERRMPVVTKRYNRLPAATRVTEEVEQARITPLRFFLIAIGIILIAFTLALMIIAYAMPALNRWNDDRSYGYPRTFHARANVGQDTKEQPYSDFTGENINGYIYVFEVQETDPSQATAHVYFVSRFSGQNKDLLAITDIMFIDENGDGKTDMVITLENGSMFVLYNDGKSFSATAPK